MSMDSRTTRMRTTVTRSRSANRTQTRDGGDVPDETAPHAWVAIAAIDAAGRQVVHARGSTTARICTVSVSSDLPADIDVRAALMARVGTLHGSTLKQAP